MTKSSVSYNLEGHPCAHCPVHSKENLKKLGIDTEKADFVVALAGNPNTGKSTVFNALTGLKQHTGNWTGKTVTRSEGSYTFHGNKYKIVDLPGTYSLISSSKEEEIARNFLLFTRPDVTVVVVDASRLERNLNLTIQVLEITSRVIICVNLIDEADRNGISIDKKSLSRDLGVPVVLTNARDKVGLAELISTIEALAKNPDPVKSRHIQRVSEEVAAPIQTLSSTITKAYPQLPNTRWLALRLLDRDKGLINSFKNGEFESILEYEDDNTGKKNPVSKDGKYAEVVITEASTLRNNLDINFHDRLTEDIYAEAAAIAEKAVNRKGEKKKVSIDGILDGILIHRFWGFPAMFILFALMFWITITGANYPSSWLYTLLIDNGYQILKDGAAAINIPWWISGLFIDGMYLATAWVISVMLPPMAIFFPLFTLLEDFGYLPRVAFNLDHIFKKVGAHGKQSMTMMMGYGCNAAGVIATRIIDSPRERLIAIITNNFAICNGRWPTQILVASLFIGMMVPAHLAGVASALSVVGVAVFGIVLTFLVSWGLSHSALKGEASVFSLELPPYRPPKILQTLYTSLIDRTMFVLWRAIVFALPAGAIIWLISNVTISGQPVAIHMIDFLDPLGWLMGLNGVILVAYIVAIPANEIVIPTILMLIVLVTGIQGFGEGTGVIFEIDSLSSLKNLLNTGGWTLLTAVNLMLFSLVHNPCSTTIYTIYRETGSVKWTAVSTFLPVIMGILMTVLVAFVWRLF
ncbi:ferrous iron transport protein B [Bacteroidota bacterium]